MVPLEAPYPGVYIDTFIFFLRSLCKIIWMNVHYFPNAPRKMRGGPIFFSVTRYIWCKNSESQVYVIINLDY